MKKKHRCFYKRFAALFASLMVSLSLCTPCFAGFDSEAVMPSLDDFYSHHGSWYVWRTASISGFSYYELLCSPISVSGSSYSLPYSVSYSTNAFDVSYLADDSGSSYDYACAFPLPLRGASGYWYELPSFPIGSGLNSDTCCVRVYSTEDQAPGSFGFLTSSFSRSDRVLSFSNTADSSSGSSTDNLDSFTFSSPFYSYPFAIRRTSSNSASGYVFQGGDNNFIIPSADYSSTRALNLDGTRYLRGISAFVSYPSGYTIPSSDIGFVFVQQPSFSPVYYSSSFDTTGSFAFSLLVPVSRLPKVQISDWLSGSSEDLQQTIIHDFDIDSDTLTETNDYLNLFKDTSSVDSGVASGASGLLGAVFQNLGTFLFSVSLLCFGAVVIRMLIKKAVAG